MDKTIRELMPWFVALVGIIAAFILLMVKFESCGPPVLSEQRKIAAVSSKPKGNPDIVLSAEGISTLELGEGGPRELTKLHHFDSRNQIKIRKDMQMLRRHIIKNKQKLEKKGKSNLCTLDGCNCYSISFRPKRPLMVCDCSEEAKAYNAMF